MKCTFRAKSFDLTADLLERANLKDRRRDIFDDLKRRWAD